MLRGGTIGPLASEDKFETLFSRGGENMDRAERLEGW